MNRNLKNAFSYFFVVAALLLQSCGGPVGGKAKTGKSDNQPAGQKKPADKGGDLSRFSSEERDYIERFNALAKEIRDFPPEGKDIEKYFHVYKSTPRLEDAEYFFFGEQHNHGLNYSWTAGAINRLFGKGDVVVFEGAEAGVSVGELVEEITTTIFAAHEFEKLKAHKDEYDSSGVDKMRKKFSPLFARTKDALALDILNFGKGTGFFWDVVDKGTGKLSKDDDERNTSLVQTMRDKRGSGKIFGIMGALHIPHYEFAVVTAIKTPAEMQAFRNTPGADDTVINDVYYNYFATLVSTKVIFDFMKGKKFAVLIPKNLPSYQSLKATMPTNVE